VRPPESAGEKIPAGDEKRIPAGDGDPFSIGGKDPRRNWIGPAPAIPVGRMSGPEHCDGTGHGTQTLGIVGVPPLGGPGPAEAGTPTLGRDTSDGTGPLAAERDASDGTEKWTDFDHCGVGSPFFDRKLTRRNS
jgi:hypothetical protein